MTGSEASRWQSDSRLDCKIAVGASASLGVSVTSLIYFSSLSQALSYDAPFVRVSNGNTRLLGISHLVSFKTFSTRLRIAQTSTSISIWISDSAVKSRTSPTFALCTSALVLTAVMSVGSISSAISFDTPILSSATTNVFFSDVSSLSKCAVWGARFGISAQSALIRIGATVSSASLWVSDSSIQARAATSAAGRSFSIQITVGVSSMHSLSAVTSLDLPSMRFPAASPLRPLNVGLTDSSSLTILGGGFSSMALSLNARTGGSR